MLWRSECGLAGLAQVLQDFSLCLLVRFGVLDSLPLLCTGVISCPCPGPRLGCFQFIRTQTRYGVHSDIPDIPDIADTPLHASLAQGLELSFSRIQLPEESDLLVAGCFAGWWWFGFCKSVQVLQDMDRMERLLHAAALVWCLPYRIFFNAFIDGEQFHCSTWES